MTSSPPPLLNPRTALVLLLALVVGILAGALSYLDDRELAAAVLWGGSAAGGALLLFDRIIGRQD